MIAALRLDEHRTPRHPLARRKPASGGPNPAPRHRLSRFATQPTDAPSKNRLRYDGAWRGAPMPQSNNKRCGNGLASTIADWADKTSVVTGGIAVTSGVLGLATAPTGAGFVGFESVAAISGGVSVLASGVGAVAHFANGDYLGAALDAGGIAGGALAGRLAGNALKSSRTFGNLSASQARQVGLSNNAAGTTAGAASSLYSCH